MRMGKLLAIGLVFGAFVLVSVVCAIAGDAVQVNINTASVEQLTGLTGIGPSHAAGIVEYRQKNGPFKNAEDLMRVSGIGPRTIEKNQGLILVEGSAGKPPQK